MKPDIPRPPETIDDRLAVLGHEYCRYALYYFRYHSTEVATVDEFVRFVREQTPEGENADETSVASRLHHVTLPKLADAGLLEYDPRNETARFRDDPAVETWLNHVVERGETPV